MKISYFVLPFLIFLNCATTKANLLVKDGKRKRLLVNNLETLDNKNIKNVVFGLTSSLTNALSKVENLEVVSSAEKANGLKVIKEKLLYGEEVDTTEFLSKLTSADYYCNGEIQTEGMNALVNIRISNSTDGSVVLSSSSRGLIDKPISLQEELVKNLLENINESKTEKLTINSTIYSTKSEEAFYRYSQASEILNTDPKKAAILLIQALKTDPEYLDALEDLSFVLYQTGELNSSKKFLKLKEEFLIKKGLVSTEDYANTLCNIGVIEFELDNIKEGFNLCYQDMSIKEKLGKVKNKGYANTIEVLGGFFISQNDVIKGIEYLEKSRNIYKEIGLDNSLDYAELLTTLGAAHFRKNNIQSAENVLNLADLIYKKLEITKTSSYATLLANQSLILIKKQEYKEALKKLIIDKEIQEKLGLVKSKNYVTTLNNISFVFGELGLKEKSNFFSKEAKKIQDSLLK